MGKWFKWLKRQGAPVQSKSSHVNDMTAQEFADAVGINVLCYSDEQDMQLSLTSAPTPLAVDTLSTSANNSTATLTFKSSSRPRLDLSLFDPPESYHSLPYPSKSKQVVRRSSTPDTEEYSQDEIKIEKKGRFIITTEQSSYYTPRRRSSVSRFQHDSKSSLGDTGSITSARSYSSSRLSLDRIDGDGVDHVVDAQRTPSVDVPVHHIHPPSPLCNSLPLHPSHMDSTCTAVQSLPSDSVSLIDLQISKLSHSRQRTMSVDIQRVTSKKMLPPLLESSESPVKRERSDSGISISVN